MSHRPERRELGTCVDWSDFSRKMAVLLNRPWRINLSCNIVTKLIFVWAFESRVRSLNALGPGAGQILERISFRFVFSNLSIRDLPILSSACQSCQRRVNLVNHA